MVVENMRTYVIGKDRRRFAVIIIIVGSLLLLASVIKGIEVIVAFIRGIPLFTLRDVSLNVVNIIFNFVIPLVGGPLLILAGNTLMHMHDQAVDRAAAHSNAEAVKTERASMIQKVLGSDERNMLDLIKSRDFVLQSDLMALTGYSKVKVHRVLKKLETKGLVRKSRLGITNRVFADAGR